MIDKVADLYLKLDNKLGAIRYYDQNISLNVIADSISICVEYIHEVDIILFNIYQGLFVKKTAKGKDVKSLIILIENSQLVRLYSMGQILQNEKEYSKENVSFLYSSLVETFYNNNVFKQLNDFFKKYKCKFRLQNLSDSAIILNCIEEIKKEIEEKKNIPNN